MSANNIVVFEEQTDGTFRAFHRDMDCYCEGQYGNSDNSDEQPIFQAATMRECVEKYDEWCIQMNEKDAYFPWIVEYGYVFELRAGNEANPS